jgi:dimethylargininase
MSLGNIALVREVPDSFPECVTDEMVSPPLDTALARTQHDGYRAALAGAGFSVLVVPGDELHPDSPFIEDTAVILGDRALATRPGHSSRRGEVAPVARALKELMPVVEMKEPALLDGGDVLSVGRTVFVGRSARTNDAGIAALIRFAGALRRRVIPVDVRRRLHLKSSVTALDGHTVMLDPSAVDAAAFTGLTVIPVAGRPEQEANVIRLPDGRILVPELSPSTADVVATAGFDPVPCNTSEFARADGGLTCLSLRIRDR